MNNKAGRKAIFLDRDGVINVENHFVYKIEDFTFIDGVFEAIHYYRKWGYLVIIITNQSGIARKYYSLDDFNKLNNWMLKQFKINNAPIDFVYLCPHGPDDNCLCRKPRSGMILDAQQDFNIDLSSSLIVGDRERDLEAGKNVGIKKLILVRNGHPVEGDTIATDVVNSLYETIKINAV